MSRFTAEGRKRARDYQFEDINRRLREDKNLRGLSRYQRGTLAALKLIGRELYADIRRRGVILPDGSVNPAVETHRKNAHEQLYSLSVYIEVNRAQASKPVNIFEWMNQADSACEPEQGAATRATETAAAASGPATAEPAS
ncbi:MAG: hypothetical protein JO166_10220 [Deltaproteobacteria bacterium]|nr:hypothetical protein [Deltaproteobacteria bacterium]